MDGNLVKIETGSGESQEVPAAKARAQTNKLLGKKLYVAQQVGCSASRIYVKTYEDFIRSHGCTTTLDQREADILLVDTCAATGEQEESSLSVIKQSQAAAKDGAQVIVCGCLAGINPRKLQEHYKGEFFSPKNEGQLSKILGLDEEDARFLSPLDPRGRFMGASDFAGVSTTMRYLAKTAGLLHTIDNKASLQWVPVLGKLLNCTQAANSKAYGLSISQGCLGNCSFCVIPMAKGQTVSLPISLIVEKVRSVVETGTRKIILTSEDTGAYGKDIGVTVVDLLRHIHSIPGDFQLYIHFFDPRWLRSYCDELLPILEKGRISYMQLPLQSGSNSVLNRMRRAYQTDQVVPFIREVRKRVPRMAISSQVIAGFPGETEEEFLQTRAILRQGLFDFVQVFAFSDRPGADTETMPGHVPAKVKQVRVRMLERDWKLARLRSLIPQARRTFPTSQRD